MRLTTVLGIVLLIGGLIFLIYPVLSFTSRDTVADIGPIEVVQEDTESLPIPPIAAGAAMVAGIALLVAGTRR
jgi:hypothetical protein